MGDNIKMDFQKFGWESKDWIELSKNRDTRQAVVDAVMNLRVT
jgi:hypothetical protein